MSTITLVSCVAKKLSVPAPAKKLYISTFFVASMKYAEHLGHPWFILSAQLGLVSPNQKIKPYEKTLNNMSKLKRQEWSREVFESLKEKIDQLKVQRIVVLAGSKYRSDLIPLIAGDFPDVKIFLPLKGLKIGQQVQWLQNQVSKSESGFFSN